MAERKAYLLRIDPELWAEIERLAQAELRSVNGQIESLQRRMAQPVNYHFVIRPAQQAAPSSAPSR